MLILSDIPDAQTKMSVSEKRFPCYIRIGNSNTAANIHSDLLLPLTHYKGLQAHCKPMVRRAGLLF